ncbi:MAG: hypothetical protein Q7S74_03635 [Nanoarchaeota archaeon]|nr:hypothetical protein [Nanoarchaeota archaeon]
MDKERFVEIILEENPVAAKYGKTRGALDTLYGCLNNDSITEEQVKLYGYALRMGYVIGKAEESEATSHLERFVDAVISRAGKYSLRKK